MGQICDCSFRTHQHNRLNEIEEKILNYEQFMEQWLVNSSCIVVIHYTTTEGMTISFLNNIF